MRTGARPSILSTVAAALLLHAHLGEAGAVSAAPDQYDPGRDPNYSWDAMERTPMNWETIWAMVREFEARAYRTVDRPQVTAPFAQPQPSHYVQGAPSFVASPLVPDAPVYGGPYLGALYPYGSSLLSWWQASPRTPWWSLIPFRSHHRHGDHRKCQGHDRHHGGHGPPPLVNPA